MSQMENEMRHNLKTLRQKNGLTLEALAERLGVSRQAAAKWERGETVPDIGNCIALADLYGVTVDSLVRNAEKRGEKTELAPAGKHIFGMVRVNDKGQITLPKHCRSVFGIRAGDLLLVLGDEAQGIAIVKMSDKFELPDTGISPKNENNNKGAEGE